MVGARAITKDRVALITAATMSCDTNLAAPMNLELARESTPDKRGGR